MGTTVAIHQPQYLPWLPYFQKINGSDIFILLDNVQYQKGGVQNRNKIKSLNGELWLTVPVRVEYRQLIKDIRIARTNWKKKHIATILQSYSRAPFGKKIGRKFEDILLQDHKYLVDLNVDIIQWMIKQFEISAKLLRASDLNVSGKKEDLVIDICKAVGATDYLSGQGAKRYHDELKFFDNQITLHYQKLRDMTYPQCFSENGFLADLSAIDLLLNVGGDAKNYL